MVTPSLSISDLVHTYGTEQAYPVRALRGVSVSVAPGEIVAVVGRSGSGKTTLLNVAATVEKLQSGSVMIDQKDISSLNPEALREMRRTTIGIVFQRYNLLPAMTALENVRLPLDLSGMHRAEADALANDMLSVLGLPEVAKRYPTQLSGGQQQRLAIGRALIGSRRVLFADEPTGALDSKSARDVMNLLRTMADSSRAAVLLVTHETENLAYADRVIELVDGRIGAVSAREEDTGVSPRG